MKQYDVPALVKADPDANATELLVQRVNATPDLPIFALPTADGGWSNVTAAEFMAQVVALSKGLISAGIQPGDKIGLMCKTRYEWTLIDFATWFAGAVLVPIYETSSPSQVQWNMIDSGAIAMITETAEHFARFDEVHADLPLIGNVWKINLGDLDKLVAAGTGVPDDEVERRRTLAKGSDLATLIYTAGTTGRPKGCILTHSNFVELCRNAQKAIPEVVNPGSSTLLFITTAHIFARFIAVLCVHGGVKVGHQSDTKQLLAAMASFRPTFLLAVPRVFEKIYNSSEQKAETAGKGAIFRSAAAVAIAHSKALDAGTVPFGLKVKFAVFDRLVLSKIRVAMGGNVKYAISGSAPLGLRLGHFYRSLGITVLEGYGLTETTAPISVNLPSNFKIGKVGPPLPGVSVRIADDGEIEAKGVNIFDGYWNNPTATAETFDGEWFKTGDIGVQRGMAADLPVGGQRDEVAVAVGVLHVGVHVLVRDVDAHAEARRQPAAHVQRHVARAVRVGTDGGGVHVGRALADKIDQAAGSDHTGFQSGQALENLHLLLVFQRHVLLAGHAHAVEAEAGGQIQRKAADRDVLVVADRGVAVAHGGVHVAEVTERARLAIVELGAGDHGDRGRRVAQRRIAEAADLRAVGAVAGLALGLHLHRRQLLYWQRRLACGWQLGRQGGRRGDGRGRLRTGQRDQREAGKKQRGTWHRRHLPGTDEATAIRTPGMGVPNHQAPYAGMTRIRFQGTLSARQRRAPPLQSAY